jgi:transcriptional regulator with XRE-family HTH domain
VAELDRTRSDLGARLRELRRAAGLSGPALAAQLGWSQSRIAKFETGRVIPSPENVQALTSALGASPEVTQALLEQARTLATQLRTWRHLRGQYLAQHQQRVRELEANCKSLRIFQPTVIPGLLQTAEYARQVFLRSAPEADAREIADAVARRMDRQRILFDTSKRLTFIIFESALRLRICPSFVLQAQLDRISALATGEHLSIGVLPFHIELPVIPSNSFVLFDQDVVLVETASAEIILRDDRDVELYVSRFETFRTAALFSAAAVRFLSDVITALQADQSDAPGGR